MLLPLSKGQEEVFNALAAYFTEHEYPPTAAELAEITHKTNVGNQLKYLKKKGWVDEIKGIKVRSNKPTEEALEKFSKKDR
jgi:SOS-response transcriptional repressor LexA